MATDTWRMNPKYAWCAIARAGRPKREAGERVGDFAEIYCNHDPDTLRAQARRCIQCADPLCMQGCPLTNRIPEWMALAAEDRGREASRARTPPTKPGERRRRRRVNRAWP